MQPTGPSNARVMIVGDFPSQYEVARQMPLVGPAADKFDQILHEAGLTRTSCFVTNLCQHMAPAKDPYSWVDVRKKPKDTSFKPWYDLHAHPSILEGEAAMRKHIALVKPNVVIALGNLPLKALTGKWGIKSWRGSVLQAEIDGHKFKVIPTYSPAWIMRDWSLKVIVSNDLKRVVKEMASNVVNVPDYRFIVRPNFATVVTYLQNLLTNLEKGPVKISCDIETRAGHIACLGFATSRHDAICIPWMCVERPEGYWDPLQEEVLWGFSRKVLLHPNARVFGQNFLYDVQYLYRFLFTDCKIWFDTMVAHHCMFPGMQKSLDFLASIHCDHYVYWKDDGKEWSATSKLGENQLWSYNCEDCVRTYEIMEQQLPAIESDKRLHTVWDFQQNTLVPRLFGAMKRGVRVNSRDKARLSRELAAEIAAREKWIFEATGQALNPKSPKQMQAFFYNDCQFKPIISRKTGTPTLDDDAVELIAKREPAVRPLVRRIQELRSLGVFKSTFVEAKPDIDGRMRSSYNPTGTDTFRLSSSTNAFWSGLNFQNIPAGSEGDPNHPDYDHTALHLPNIRKLYIPDEGMTMFDMDLDRADLQVVVWEADDEELRQALREGVDLHSLNAKTLFNLSCSVNEIKKLHNDKRQLAKAWVHGTNYGGGPRTMAITCGITIREAEKLQARWFEAHPGILAWHRRQENMLKTRRIVENKFGFRYTFFDRIDAALPQALAWVPQSSVGVVINKAWDNIMNRVPGVEILIQVHDSLVGQFPTAQADAIIPQILEAARIVIPYDKPLIIPAGIKTSTVSWGDCA